MRRWDITANPKMKKNFLLLSSLLCVTTIWAQINLAVMDFQPGSNMPAQNLSGLSDMLINSLHESGHYEIAERSQINYVLREMGVQTGQNLSVAQLTRLGQYLRVDYVFVGTVNFIATGYSSSPGYAEGEYNIDVRIVDINTSRIIATAGVVKNAAQTYRSLMPELASQLSIKLSSGSLPCIQGYLYVYPECLGKSLYQGAVDKVDNLNAANACGRNNWRLPTTDELKAIAENHDKIRYWQTIKEGYAISSESRDRSVDDRYNWVNVWDFSREKQYKVYFRSDWGVMDPGWVIPVSTK